MQLEISLSELAVRPVLVTELKSHIYLFLVKYLRRAMIHLFSVAKTGLARSNLGFFKLFNVFSGVEFDFLSDIVFCTLLAF